MSHFGRGRLPTRGPAVEVVVVGLQLEARRATRSSFGKGRPPDHTSHIYQGILDGCIL